MSDAAGTLATTASALQGALSARGTRARHRIAAVLRAVAFWAAAVLPLAYAPFLVSVVPAPAIDLLAALLVVHACCLLAGHGYRPHARA